MLNVLVVTIMKLILDRGNMGHVTRVIKDDWSAKIPEYLDIDPNPKWVTDEVQSNELLKPIPKDFLHGVTMEVDHFGIKQYEIRNEKDSYLRFDINSWVGLSAGAVHVYGTLKLWGVETGHVGESGSCSGYLGAPDEEKPIAFKFVDLKVKIVRPIEQRDLDHADGDRYHGYRLGEMTRDWWEEEDLIKEGKRIAKKYFPDYKLVIDN